MTDSDAGSDSDSDSDQGTTALSKCDFISGSLSFAALGAIVGSIFFLPLVAYSCGHTGKSDNNLAAHTTSVVVGAAIGFSLGHGVGAVVGGAVGGACGGAVVGADIFRRDHEAQNFWRNAVKAARGPQSCFAGCC